MSVSNPNKTIDVQSMSCAGRANVTISFDASSDLITKPADIILIMDTSSSMAGERIDLAKEAAVKLVDTVVKASNGTKKIENSSRIGFVSFSSIIKEKIPLTDNVVNIKNAINDLSAGGNTNHYIAFSQAKELLDQTTANDKIVVMFTDGVTTEGPNPDEIAENLKNSGAEIFCIGILKDDSPLKRWASKPDSTHVASSDDPAKISELFEKIAYEVSKAGAYDVAIKERLNSDFKIVNIGNVTDGEINIVNAQTFEWNIPAVGIGQNEKVSAQFEIMHIGINAGIKEVNRSIDYSDRAGDTLNFPNPTVNVECGGSIINPEICPNSIDFKVEGCKDAVAITSLDVGLQSIGRVVQVDVPVKNVCPNKRAAAAVILSEVDTQGIEHARGMKTVLIPALSGNTCQDILLKCISFVVPEELDVTGNKNTMCNERQFRVRAFANYIDTDFVCCDSKTVIINS